MKSLAGAKIAYCSTTYRLIVNGWWMRPSHALRGSMRRMYAPDGSAAVEMRTPLDSLTTTPRASTILSCTSSPHVDTALTMSSSPDADNVNDTSCALPV